MELLDENRSLLHAGKVLGRPDNTIQELNSGWTELNALLFDNYREQFLLFYCILSPFSLTLSYSRLDETKREGRHDQVYGLPKSEPYFNYLMISC